MGDGPSKDPEGEATREMGENQEKNRLDKICVQCFVRIELGVLNR